MSEDLAAKAAEKLGTLLEWRVNLDGEWSLAEAQKLAQDIICSVYSEQTAELERLRKDMRKALELAKFGASAMSDNAALRSQVAELQQQVERLTEDAERYRGMRDSYVHHFNGNPSDFDDKVDAAIDAARAR